MSPPQIRKIIDGMRSKHIQKGQIILYQGDTVPEIFVLTQGIIKIYDIDENGNEKILHLMKQPGVLPFAFFSGRSFPARWFYSAMTDIEVYLVPPDRLEEEFVRDPAFGMYLMHWFSQEVHEILTRLSSLGKTTARDKLIAALKFLALLHSSKRRSGWWRVTFPVSHQLLADMVGITRESAALAMKELQDEKIVRNPRVTILEIDRAKLESGPAE